MNDLFVEYLKPATDETPFTMHTGKWQFCWCKYSNGKIDLGVYSFAGDVCYGYAAWRGMHNLN